MFKTLEELITVIRQRKGSLSENPYTNKLLNDKKLSVEKVKEEIAELIEAIEKIQIKFMKQQMFLSPDGSFKANG